MTTLEIEFPLLFKRVWSARQLAAEIAAIAPDRLHAEYRELQRRAPRRTQTAGKQYFVGHRGRTPDTAGSSRLEERLAVALYNLKLRLTLPSGEGFRLLDYQVPLKAVQADRGVGKVDLLGVTEPGQLLIVELKYIHDGGGRGEAPPVALMEGLRYASIVQANHEDIARQAEAHFGMRILERPPKVLLLGPEAWWESWLTLRAAGAWAAPFSRLLSEFQARTGVTIEPVALGKTTVIGEAVEPRLDRVPSLLPVRLENAWAPDKRNAAP